jgi:formylglycine-generating enzyme required for sulfatase activity
MNRCLAAVALAGLLAACGPQPVGDAPVVLELRIDNEERLPITVDVVNGDDARQVAGPDCAAGIRLALRAGSYIVRAATPDGDIALPAPLLPDLLPDRTLRVTVHTPPPRDVPAFAFVPAGPAVIGDTLGIGQEDERPARVVDVPAFWLACREVTNAEFAAFLTAAEPHVDEAWCAFDSRKCRVARDGAGRWTTDAPALPIVTVSLPGALAYCAWRTRATGVHHRLPSEVEWEKAARGPASYVFAYGNVYRRAAANQESGELRAVGRYAPNGFGIHDLTGNAFEWTSDVYPGAPGFQVLRGGSFVLDGMYLRNSFRMRQRPDVRTDDIGFRVACDALPQPD